MNNHLPIPSSIRDDFPILKQYVHHKPLVYLDNAATTQKPVQVLDAMQDYYQTINSNIHRGVYAISMEATSRYEAAREHIRAFINARESAEIIFTRGTTEAINLVASSFSARFLQSGDEVLITTMEHHANIVPWQMACERMGASLKVVPIQADGQLNMDAYRAMLGPRVRIAAFTHVSNVMGIVNPVKEMIRLAHEVDIPVLVDGAQAISHINVDVRELDCDFYCFSGHKVYGPMGIGVLYGKRELLENMPPWQGGGEMIEQVSFEKTTYNELPYKFEAGTPNVAEVIGLDAALTYLEQLGLDRIRHHENQLMVHCRSLLQAQEGIRFIGDHPGNTAVLSFLVEGIHHYDLGSVLDKFGIAIRTGHHCAQPLMTHLGLSGTMRVSMGMYNTIEEIDVFAEGLQKARAIFA